MADPASARAKQSGSGPDAILRIRKRLAAMGAENVLRQIARKHGVAPNDLLVTTRHTREARARHELIALVTWTAGLSTPQAGRLFEIDHTSVVAQCLKREGEIGVGLVAARP